MRWPVGQSGWRGFHGASGLVGSPTVTAFPSEGPTRPFQPLTPIESPQEPGSIITTVSTDKRPRTLKGFTWTTQQGSPLSR